MIASGMRALITSEVAVTAGFSVFCVGIADVWIGAGHDGRDADKLDDKGAGCSKKTLTAKAAARAKNAAKAVLIHRTVISSPPQPPPAPNESKGSSQL
jgi:hypothetical protein